MVQAKIAILTSAHPPLDVRIFHKELKSLRKAGFQVTLMAPTLEVAYKALEETGVSYIPLGEFKNRLSRIILVLRMLGQLKENQYDIWHFHDPDLLPLLVLWKWLLRRRAFLIYDAHEDVPKDILDKNWIPKWVRKPIAFLYGALERFGVKHCKVVIAATDSIHDHLKTKTGIVVTVHNYPFGVILYPGRLPQTHVCELFMRVI